MRRVRDHFFAGETVLFQVEPAASSASCAAFPCAAKVFFGPEELGEIVGAAEFDKMVDGAVVDRDGLWTISHNQLFLSCNCKARTR
jgi:hypothetical protein